MLLILPLSPSFTKDRQLTAFAVLQANEIGSLPSLPTKDFCDNKNNQLNSSFILGPCDFLNNVKADCNFPWEKKYNKYCLCDAWNFGPQKCHLFLQNCFLTRACVLAITIDLKAGAHIICHRLTCILSPKHSPVITEDRHSYNWNTNPDPSPPPQLGHSLSRHWTCELLCKGGRPMWKCLKSNFQRHLRQSQGAWADKWAPYPEAGVWSPPINCLLNVSELPSS